MQIEIFVVSLPNKLVKNKMYMYRDFKVDDSKDRFKVLIEKKNFPDYETIFDVIERHEFDFSPITKEYKETISLNESENVSDLINRLKELPKDAKISYDDANKITVLRTWVEDELTWFYRILSHVLKAYSDEKHWKYKSDWKAFGGIEKMKPSQDLICNAKKRANTSTCDEKSYTAKESRVGEDTALRNFLRNARILSEFKK